MGASSSLGPTLTITTSLAIGCTTLAVLLRCYVRLVLQRRFASDDYLIVFCQVMFLCFQYCVLQEANNGIGHHLMDVEPLALIKGLKYWWTAQTFFILATCTVKVTIAIFFCRLSPPKILRWAAIGAATLSVVDGVGTEIYQVFQCAPVSYFWNRINPLAKGHCWDPYKAFAVLQTVNSFDALSDVMLAVLPCIMVWNMKMTPAKKAGVSILLGLSILSAVCAIVRAFYFKDMLLDTADFTYTAWPVTITSSLEPGIAITVVCIAQLRPLMKQIFPKGWFTKTTQSGPSNVITIGRLGGSDHKKRSKHSDVMLSTLDECDLKPTGEYHGLRSISSSQGIEKNEYMDIEQGKSSDEMRLRYDLKP